MNVLIFGSGGYLGSHLLKHLAASGHSVSGFVRNDAAAAKVRQQGGTPVLGDLEKDLDSALAQVSQADATIFAAQLMLEPENKVVGAMLDALAGSNKTFIFTSGTGVLSERTDGNWSENTFAETDEFVPSKYIGARCDTEKMVEAAAQRGVRAMVVRPPLIWGNGGCPMIKAFYESAEKTGAVCYIGRGLNLYSSVHVDDLAELYRLVLEQGDAGKLYHAVSGETNFRSLAEGVARTLNLPTRSIDLGEGAEIWGKFTALIGLSTCSRSRSPRSRRELGWAPSPGRLDIMDETHHPAFMRIMEG